MKIALALMFLQATQWNVRQHIPLAEFTIQSHRGAGELMPENSMEAFELAWKLGTVPEADLRTTSDGVIVAFHDENFSRILPGEPQRKRQGVKDLSWAEVQKLDVGAWKGPAHKGQRVASMAQVFAVLAAHPERRVYVDIKNVDLAQLAKQAQDSRVARQLILASTIYSVIRQWKQLAPDSSTLHWMGGTEAQLSSRLDDLRKAGFADITQLQIHVRRTAPNAQTFTPSPSFLRRAGEELRSHGTLFQVLPYDVKEPETIWKLLDLGVASFATDYPDTMMKAVRDYYALSN
jgi:glycerophosphoryl diester phosphodiesterase